MAHVLIVESDTATREFIDATLRQAGYGTVRALDAREAVAMAGQFGPFDLLIAEAGPVSEQLAAQLREVEPRLRVLYLNSLDAPTRGDALLHAVSSLLSGASPAADGSTPAADASLPSDPTHDSRVRLLLVEDDAAYAQFAQEMLENVGSGRFQVERTDLPVVILSGTDNEVLALEAVKAGAQDYLMKGQATPDLLAKAIRYGIERKQSELNIKRLAYFDSLTGLPNRRLLMEHLNLALKRVARTDSVIGVFFIDVDHFKQINDTLGHGAGDRVLQQLANGLSQSLRASDTLARLSGDEFVAVVEVAETRQLPAVAAGLQHRLKTPFATTDGEIFVTASIGVSAYPTDGSDAEELLRNADRALYQAKAQGRDAVRFYAAELETARSSQVAFKSALRRSIERGELRVHFQPIVDLRTGEVDGLEALLRWQHPGRGVILPGDFIPLAEESGLIVLIERWVLETAMTEVSSYGSLKQLKLAINLSRRHFDSSVLLKELKGIIRHVGYDASLLELELTESGIMHHPKRVLRHLNECRRLGINVTVDDFGTGYSSLGLMRTFPLHALKIDRSFVRNCGTDPTNRGLVAAIISVGHALGLQVTAEGVERGSGSDWAVFYSQRRTRCA